MICKMRQLDVQVSTSHQYKEGKTMMYTNKDGMISSETARQIAMTKTYLINQYGDKWYDKYEVCYSDTDGVYVKEK